MRVDIGKKCPGITDGLILANKYRVTALDLQLEIGFHSLSLAFIYRFSSNLVRESIL